MTPHLHATTRREEEGERGRRRAFEVGFEVGFDGVGRLASFAISTRHNAKGGPKSAFLLPLFAKICVCLSLSRSLSLDLSLSLSHSFSLLSDAQHDRSYTDTSTGAFL